jgi:dihydrofolate synthase/folylpolyglutamate synthase
VNFPETLAYLDRLQETRMRMDLTAGRELLEALGGPDRALRSVIVAGTNGKGSVCAFLTSIAREGGLRVGTYTSPHLESVTERVAVGGKPIDQETFARIASRVRAVIEERRIDHITYFEFVTILAVLAFQEEACGICIFEVGLGGRLDTVNLLERFGVAITRIDYDHLGVLGNTLGEIATEKGAVMRRDRFAVLAPQEPEAEARLSAMAAEIGADLVRTKPEAYPVGLRGDHQSENAGVAVAVIDCLNRSGFRIPEEAVRAGLKNVRHPGRLELFEGREGPDVWLDVAHNTGSVKALALFISENRIAPVNLLVGILADKEWKTMLDLLLPLAAGVTVCRPDSPRAWDPAEALAYIGNRVLAHRIDSPAEALDFLLKSPLPVLCTGSFYVIGAARRKLIEMKLNPSP